MYRPIRDYAIIGNLRSAVLVSKDGSIDWAPAPFIDSPSVFAALLDDTKGGFWKISPEGAFSSTQHYMPETNVLVTEFMTQGGTAELVDFIPIEKEKTFVPAEKDTTFKIHRRITCTKGVCKIRVTFNPKFDYSRGITKLTHTKGGIFIENKEKRGILSSHLPFVIKDDRAVADIRLEEGQTHFLIFRYNASKDKVAFRERSVAHHNAELEAVQQYWKKWSRKCDLNVCPPKEMLPEAVVRSALLLKILFFEPIGTVAAAATTSLPEAIGGVRNWDYRYTWLRDSAFIFQAFFRLGHVKEAKEYIRWLVDECYAAIKKEDDLTHLQIMYGLRGEKRLDEEILPHLKGYRGSRPVRIGNNGYLQEQWDTYGSVLDVLWRLHELKGRRVINERTRDMVRAIADHVVDVWRRPDEGLWEVRGGKAHFVYSKVMCWVALDRAIKLAKTHHFNGETARWRKERNLIRRAVMEQGWDAKKRTFTQSFGSSSLDASVLRMSAVGFIDGRHPRMLSTIEAVEREICRGDGLVLRYTSQDGLPGREGAFLLASFWLVDALVAAGKIDRARALFDRIIKKGNHVGLFSEEMNPKTEEFLGNFPQAYTHVGLINSSFNLMEAEQRFGYRFRKILLEYITPSP